MCESKRSGWVKIKSVHQCPLVSSNIHSVLWNAWATWVEQCSEGWEVIRKPFGWCRDGSSCLTRLMTTQFLAVNWCGFKEFWGLPQVEALLTSVPRGRLLVLDLDSTDRQDLQPHQSFTFFSGSSTQELPPTQGNHSFSTWSTRLGVR